MKSIPRILRAHGSDFWSMFLLLAGLLVFSEILLGICMYLAPMENNEMLPLGFLMVLIIGGMLTPLVGSSMVAVGLCRGLQFSMPRRRLLPGMLVTSLLLSLLWLVTSAIALGLDWVVCRFFMPTASTSKLFELLELIVLHAGFTSLLWPCLLTVLATAVAFALFNLVAGMLIVWLGKAGLAILYCLVFSTMLLSVNFSDLLAGGSLFSAALRGLAGLLPANNLSGPSCFDFEAPAAPFKAGQAPAKAAAAVVDAGSAVELYAGFGKNVYTALATVAGEAVGVVATGEKLCHNCAVKASRFVRLCDAFGLPVVTIAATEGFVPSATDDIAGGIREAARLAGTYADATTARVCLLAGKAVGPVYTALAAADWKIAVRGCVVAPLEPAAAVSVLDKEEIDASDNIVAATNVRAAAYAKDVCSADAAVAAGAADTACDPAGVRAAVVAALDMLRTKRAARLPKKHGNMAL